MAACGTAPVAPKATCVVGGTTVTYRQKLVGGDPDINANAVSTLLHGFTNLQIKRLRDQEGGLQSQVQLARLKCKWCH
eukprot:3884910-Amphidinium_carterae.1